MYVSCLLIFEHVPKLLNPAYIQLGRAHAKMGSCYEELKLCNLAQGAATSSVKQENSGSTLSTIHGLETLLSLLNLEEKLPAAANWCQDEGAESVEDLMEEDYADQLAKFLQLPQIKRTRLIKAIKSWKPSQAVAPTAAQAPAADTPLWYTAAEQLSEPLAVEAGESSEPKGTCPK